MRQDEMRDFMLRAEGEEDGEAWINLLLQKHARVLFELQWMLFMFGQAGAMFEAVKQDKTRGGELAEMIGNIEEGCKDLETAAAEVTTVARDMLANNRRNLEKATR